MIFTKYLFGNTVLNPLAVRTSTSIRQGCEPLRFIEIFTVLSTVEGGDRVLLYTADCSTCDPIIKQHVSIIHLTSTSSVYVDIFEILYCTVNCGEGISMIFTPTKQRYN